MTEWFKIRALSPWPIELKTGGIWFSPTHETEKADALLCSWGPSSELFTFPRRKAWYCSEPWCQFRGMESGTWPKIRERLAPGEFLWYNHPDARYRVPHVTHYEELQVNFNLDRIPKAIAIVSNNGGNPWRRHPDIAFRNRFATHPLVDLYGRSSWKSYRAGWLSPQRPPVNYCGEIPGDWNEQGKRELMARYQVAICLENMLEPHYFTEKFVEAVCAGCVPVYRAHETVRTGVLSEAAWIDPGDEASDPGDSLTSALALSRDEMKRAEIADRNQSWLESEALRSTHHREVFARIGTILAGDVVV